MPRKPKLHKLTFSLLKDGLMQGHALRNADTVDGYRVPAIDANADSLFVEAKSPHPPGWAAYLASHVAEPLEGLFTASASAVLLLEAKGRVFAVTFGQGRHLLDAEALEQDFGLRIVLNTVAPDQLKSVDAKTIEETTVHTRRDVSRDSAFSAFGLDISRDLLRAVTGTPRDESLAHRLTGADALGIQTRARVPDLTELAERLFDAYEADDYKEHFDFIDHLRPEKDAARVGELDAALVGALATHEITDAHLAAPETLDWLDIDGFRLSSISGNDLRDKDPRISTYLDSYEQGEIDVACLKRDRLIAIRASDGEAMATWPMYRCIVYQTEIDGHLYVLSTGQWFRVDLDYKNKLYAEVNAIDPLNGLPDADPGTDEDEYNLKAANAIDALCLDKKLVYDGGPDKMEICDILTREAGLIHVKHRGSSSTLSHLFAQGVNSAERLLLDQDFRSKARAVAAREKNAFADVLPAGRPQPGDHEISFVVITRSTRETPLTLPFFSLVNLRVATSRLQSFGFRVSIAAVHESSS
jgi:uncharacterized protein (TIGR04141 family)